MKVLHVTAHLGGGVGKAHSALVRAGPSFVKRHYVLLEEPRDRRYAENLLASGATLTIAPDATALARSAAEADIVQIEWWNHPRIYHCLHETGWPAMRTVFWCHISGLAAPFVPPALLTTGDRFLFTSACSFQASAVKTLDPAFAGRLGVVNSGFGLPARLRSSKAKRRPGMVSYLGTVDFAKMSRSIFEVADIIGEKTPVDIWGEVAPDGPVTAAAGAMRHPDRIRLMGHTADPANVFQATDIFLYLLDRDHFGTAENALVEAMSCGCVPIVFTNPAEMEIVENGRTGFVVADAAEAVERVNWLRHQPEKIEEIGHNAADQIAATRMPAYSAAAFARIYGELMLAEKRPVDFRPAIGATAADWFLGTRVPHSETGQPDIGQDRDGASKGTFSHFLSCYPSDESLRRLAAGR